MCSQRASSKACRFFGRDMLGGGGCVSDDLSVPTANTVVRSMDRAGKTVNCIKLTCMSPHVGALSMSCSGGRCTRPGMRGTAHGVCPVMHPLCCCCGTRGGRTMAPLVSFVLSRRKRSVVGGDKCVPIGWNCTGGVSCFYDSWLMARWAL